MSSIARGGRTAQLALGVAVWLWIGALLIAPNALRPLGASICHQRPERSFVVSGTPLPVCARCTGLYLGAALAAPFVLGRPRAFATGRPRMFLAVAALPTAATWTLEFAGLFPFSNASRFIAALPLGFAAASLVLHTLVDE